MAIYSHSRISTYEQCPLRYKYKYIDEIKKQEQTIEAFMGTRVHEVLEKLYAELAQGRLNTLEELYEYYRTRWKATWTEQVRVVKKGRNSRQYFQLGAQCIRNYYEEYRPFGQCETVETEAHVKFALDAAGQRQFQGYIDRVARRKDGTYEIHDYKTGKSLATQAQANADRQLALYQIGLAARLKEKPRVELVWHYLQHSKTIRSRRTERQLVQVAKTTTELIERIESAKRFPARTGPLCHWCEYRMECPAFERAQGYVNY